MQRNIFICYLMAVMSLFAVSKALACSCVPHNDDLPTAVARAYEQADAVFLGRAGSKHFRKDSIAGSHETDFIVEDRWKGLTGDTIKVRTNTGEAACGYRFHKSTRYLVFAYKTKDKILTTNLCELTQPAGQADETIEILNQLAGRKKGSGK